MHLRTLLFCILAFFGAPALAQSTGDSINQTDAQGKPDGLWYTQSPGGRGEPGTVTFGRYVHGEKSGIWYLMDDQSVLISSETFKHNVRDGEAKYFESGKLTAVGHFRGLNPKVALDTMIITDPNTGEERLISVPTERGSVRHGIWRFYDDLSGRLVREEDYQMDELIFKRDFSLSPADSAFIQKRNAQLPHNGGRDPVRSHKLKNPTRSLID